MRHLNLAECKGLFSSMRTAHRDKNYGAIQVKEVVKCKAVVRFSNREGGSLETYVIFGSFVFLVKP